MITQAVSSLSAPVVVARATEEQWRPIPDCEGLYSVSSLGRVRSDPIQTSRVGKQRGRILKCCSDTKGYLFFRVCLSGKRRRTMKLHRAVALAFLGPKPDGYQVNHKSGDKLDNSVGNLEYVTCRENILHAWETGLCSAKHCRGENNPFAKLTAEQVREIRRLSTQMSLSQLARRFGVSKPCISGIINGKAWKHVPIEEPDVATATWMPDVIRLDDVVLSDAPAGDVVVQSS